MLTRRAILLAMGVTGLSACSGERAVCVRKSDGVALHGTVMRYGDNSVREYDVADDNGLVGAINASNSNEFSCKVNPS